MKKLMRRRSPDSQGAEKFSKWVEQGKTTSELTGTITPITEWADGLKQQAGRQANKQPGPPVRRADMHERITKRNTHYRYANATYPRPRMD